MPKFLLISQTGKLVQVYSPSPRRLKGRSILQIATLGFSRCTAENKPDLALNVCVENDGNARLQKAASVFGVLHKR